MKITDIINLTLNNEYFDWIINKKFFAHSYQTKRVVRVIDERSGKYLTLKIHVFIHQVFSNKMM